jgi:hypothetical protein
MQKMILTAVVLFGLTILTLRAPHAQEDKPLAREKKVTKDVPRESAAPSRPTIQTAPPQEK